MSAFLRDVHYAVRVLRRTPAFTVTTVMILALAIGANVALFSIVDAWFFRPLHFRDSNQVVIALRRDLKRPGEIPVFAAYRDYVDWKPAARSFQGMSAMYWQSFTMTESGVAAKGYFGLNVSADMFETLGVSAELGRTFLEPDLSGPPVVVISHQLWQERFGGSRAIVGRVLTLNSKSYTVLGVLPAGFSLRMENQATDPQILALMQPSDPDYRPGSRQAVAVIARLKPGIDMAAAQAELFAVQMAIDAKLPDGAKGYGVFLTRLQMDNARFIRTSLITLMAAVVLVLLIACANVAGLLLGRAAYRQREMALRTALGSGRGRLARQLLTESLVLGLAGATAGVLFAYAGVRGFMAANPFNQLPPDPITIQPRALAFAAVLALVNTVLFGAAPAWRSSRVDLGTFLKSRGAGFGRVGPGRNALVAVEVALSLMLLSGTAMVSRAVVKLLTMPLGFRPEHVEVSTVNLPAERYETDHAHLTGFYDQVLERVRALPGVQAAAFTNRPPLTGGLLTSLRVAGRPEPPADETLRFEHQIITPRYFELLSAPLLRGRWFNDGDTESSAQVVIINEAVARSQFPDSDPVGQQIRLGKDDPWRTIVGVAGSLRTIFYNTLDAKEPRTIYVPARQSLKPGFSPRSNGVWLMLKSERPLALEDIRREVSAVDATVVVSDLRTMDRVLSDAIGQPRQRTVLLAGFALLALLLSTIGVYGLMAQNTAQRTKEIGIRMALGAETGDVLRMVIRQGISVAAVGIVLGIAAALTSGRLLASMLYGVSATDLMSYVVVAVVVLAVSALAAYIPARRASHVDPLEALRYE